ncbi:MAG: GTP-binding protein [Candidatus Heimdallarchaeota archaeon]|nr:GTP-binding protein [Candidatus Heimdallarchaeota archaeon]
MSQSKMKKVILLGTTGSGKTTFLKNLIGLSKDNFADAEVPRRIKLEVDTDNTFSPVEEGMFDNSTTTISFNVKPVIFTLTKTNNFNYYPLKKNEIPFDEDDIDCVFPVLIIDTAGQERFSFIPEMSMKGIDGAFIFSDGSNIQSVERIAQYLEMVKEEQIRQNKKIPVMVFVNKKDLESKGIYVGKESVERWLTDPKITICETTNHDMESFLIHIRNFLSDIPGLPLKLQEILLKS